MPCEGCWGLEHSGCHGDRETWVDARNVWEAESTLLLPWASIGAELVRHPRGAWNEPLRGNWGPCTWV